MPSVELKIPLKTVSEGNSSEHWTKKHKRHKKQKLIVRTYLNRIPKNTIQLPVIVSIIRLAPRSLDAFDNLPVSLKWIADAIADWLIPGLKAGRADSSSEIKFECSQEKGNPKEYAVIIKIKKDIASN